MSRLLATTEIDSGTSALATRGPVADTLDQIFEPIRFETLADVFEGYRKDREKMAQIAAFFDGSHLELVKHFISANTDDRNYVNIERLFQLDTAIKALDAEYWQKALKLTDVLESMPQKRRDEWYELVKKHETPPFDETTVVSTLQDLLAQRHKFFSERVDGIFRSLSHEHVTNRPEGFSRRMIIAYVIQGGITCYSRGGTINDLRCVIARFMGRGEPRSYDALRIVEYARREHCGDWVNIDGGSLRVRVYKNGNAHLEVHPEMAWRLNNVLASLYPNAIPEEHRRRPNKKPAKDFKFFNRPLPFPVLEMLAEARTHGGDLKTIHLGYEAEEKPVYRETCDVLSILGGIKKTETMFEFDYPVSSVLREITVSGMIPDQRVHQYYPTPSNLAQRVVNLAQIEPHHSVLEPSAGQGGIADFLPKTQTTLVEVAPLHCKVLQAKGFPTVLTLDFLKWDPKRRFDRVVMNPPFTNSQWERHLEHSASLVAAGGRIVSVLPVGAVSRKTVLPGWSCTWSTPEAFPGTSIETVILTADHPLRP